MEETYDEVNEEYKNLTTKQVAFLTEKQIKRYTKAGISINRINGDIKLCIETLKSMNLLKDKKQKKDDK